MLIRVTVNIVVTRHGVAGSRLADAGAIDIGIGFRLFDYKVPQIDVVHDGLRLQTESGGWSALRPCFYPCTGRGD
ncbi:hypothetical protein D3C80_1997470 [compost metagenome]